MSGPIYWPIKGLCPRMFSLSKMFSNATGNQSIEGISQNATANAGRWRVDAKEFSLVDKRRVLLWRALSAMIDGKSNQIVLPVYEADRPPNFEATLATSSSTSSIPHSDGSLFSDGTGYAQYDYSAVVIGTVPIGATQLTMNFFNQPMPDVGNLFSIGVRLYTIKRFVEIGASTATLSIWPPIRDEIANDAVMNFDLPTGLFRLATSNEMENAEMHMARYGAGDVSFVEDSGPIQT